MAAFVLAAITDDHAKGQAVVAGSGLMPICLNHLPHAASPAGSPLFVRWLCLCLGKLWDNFLSLQVGLDTTFHNILFCTSQNTNDDSRYVFHVTNRVTPGSGGPRCRCATTCTCTA